MKDVLNSIVSVVSEQMEESVDKIESVGVIVVGDMKIVRPSINPLENEGASGLNCDENSEKMLKLNEEDSTLDIKPIGSNDDDEEDGEEAEAVTCESSTSDECSTSSKDSSPKETRYDHKDLIKKCIEALKQCLHRFPQHYKSLYRLAHYYFHSKYHKVRFQINTR